MGTALRFNEEARACAVAHYLAAKGFGVLWEPGKPHVVMCSGEREELRPIIAEYKAVDEEWFKREAVDVDDRRGGP
jgi:hypothetical protein